MCGLGIKYQMIGVAWKSTGEVGKRRSVKADRRGSVRGKHCQQEPDQLSLTPGFGLLEYFGEPGPGCSISVSSFSAAVRRSSPAANRAASRASASVRPKADCSWWFGKGFWRSGVRNDDTNRRPEGGQYRVAPGHGAHEYSIRPLAGRAKRPHRSAGGYAG